jgi:hypothetical protein
MLFCKIGLSSYWVFYVDSSFRCNFQNALETNFQIVMGVECGRFLLKTTYFIHKKEKY